MLSYLLILTQGPVAAPGSLRPGVPPVIGLRWKRMIKRKERITIKTIGGEEICLKKKSELSGDESLSRLGTAG